MNENLWTLGFVVFIVVVILWSASFVYVDENSLRYKIGKFIYGDFSLILLYISLYLVWIGLFMPKPTGEKFI